MVRGLQIGKKELVEAANHLLANSPLKSYASVWNRMTGISRETGVRFKYPMDNMMVQTLVAALIKRGLKAGTILSYMSAIRQGHLLRGLTAPALSDTMVQAAIKGLKNKESLVETPRAVMTLQLLAKARDKLK